MGRDGHLLMILIINLPSFEFTEMEDLRSRDVVSLKSCEEDIFLNKAQLDKITSYEPGECLEIELKYWYLMEKVNLATVTGANTGYIVYALDDQKKRIDFNEAKLQPTLTNKIHVKFFERVRIFSVEFKGTKTLMTQKQTIETTFRSTSSFLEREITKTLPKANSNETELIVLGIIPFSIFFIIIGFFCCRINFEKPLEIDSLHDEEFPEDIDEMEEIPELQLEPKPPVVVEEAEKVEESQTKLEKKDKTKKKIKPSNKDLTSKPEQTNKNEELVVKPSAGTQAVPSGKEKVADGEAPKKAEKKEKSLKPKA